MRPIVYEQLLKFFIVFATVVEPISLIPAFAGLTAGGSPQYKRKMAIKATLISFGICVLFALGGARFLELMGISLAAFRLAGGTLLFLIALEMVFARESGTRTTGPEQEECSRREDISVFPLAFPFISGPGALATILLGAGDVAAQPLLLAGLLLAVALVLALCLIAMLATPRLMKVIGVTGANVVNRLSGVVLAALAAQFIVDGIRGSFMS